VEKLADPFATSANGDWQEALAKQPELQALATGIEWAPLDKTENEPGALCHK